MEAEVIDIRKQRDGILVEVECGNRKESCLFSPANATEENIAKFAENVQRMYEDHLVELTDAQFNSLLSHKGKKFDKKTGRLK